jgi:predicted N-acetyltransferase YhbS
MRVLPAYQGRGLGGIMLRWGLERATQLGKRIFLLSSPEGRLLYAKYGFETVGSVKMDLGKYGGQGTYVQTAMTWNEGKQDNKLGIWSKRKL